MSRALLVFLKYTTNKTKQIFTNGKPLFIGSLNPYSQMYNDDGIEWDEFQLVKYSNKRNYKKDVSEFNNIKSNFIKYRIISLKLYSKVRLILNEITERIKNLIYPYDVSINLKKQESPRKRKKKD